MSFIPLSQSPVKLARFAGLLYLILAFVGPVSLMIIPSQVTVPGDAAATVANIVEHETLFRFSFIGDSALVLIEVVLVVILYLLLKPVSPFLSLTAALARMAMLVIQGVNMLPNFAILGLLTNPEQTTAFSPEQIQTLVTQLLALRDSGAMVWQVFFGFHLVILGYLFFKSRYIPRIISVLAMIAALSYLLDSFGMMLYPAGEAIYGMIVFICAVVGEMALTFWLLIKGVKVPAVE